MRNEPIPRHLRGLTIARLSVQVLFGMLLALTVAAQGPPVFPSVQGQGALEVMTFNMYVGTEYTGIPQAPTLNDLYQAVTNAINDVRTGNPPARTQKIAQQIAAAKPDLVALQEVATWSTGTYTGTWTGDSTCDNLALEFDYRQLLLDALAAQGVRYTPLATNTHFTVNAPTSATECVQNTWSIVVIARADLIPEDFFYTTDSGVFAHILSIPITALPGYSLPWPRGWISADVTYRGKQFRFIAPHLERVLPPPILGRLNIAQGLELLSETGPTNTTMPAVVAGDMNSDAANASDPAYPTYQNFLKAGFTDAWTAARSLFDSGFSGYTKTFPESMNKRSDLVLVRGGFRVQAAAVLCGGSDHCGVVARLQLPGE
jgi:endonuclease/exonuclease/phosphatase family metal-dependent hydrolase